MQHPALRSLLVLAAAASLAACDDEGTGPESPATVQGVVEQTTPGTAETGSPPAAPGTDAGTVVVAQIEGGGSLTALAEGEVDAEAAYVVQGVPAGREDLAVIAYVGDRQAGRVLVYEATSGGGTLGLAPITYETTAEGRAWSSVKAEGSGDETSPAEIALMIHLQGNEGEAMLTDGGIDVLAEALTTASATLTTTFEAVGASLDAEARAEILSEYVVAWAEARFQGTPAAEAHDGFVNAAMGGLLQAEEAPTLEDVVLATAAAASTLDATLEGRIEQRGPLVAQPVRINLLTRSGLANRGVGGAFSELAVALENLLLGTRTAVRGASTAAEVRTALEASLTSTRTLAVTAMVQALASGAPLSVQTQVSTFAEGAFEAARLSSALAGAATPADAATAVVETQAEVLAEVEAMIQAAGSPETDAEAIASLFLAAAAGPHVR